MPVEEEDEWNLLPTLAIMIITHHCGPAEWATTELIRNFAAEIKDVLLKS